MNIARYFDAAVLKPDMTPEQVEAAIKESISFDSYSVCVRGCDIDLAMKPSAQLPVIMPPRASGTSTW